MNEILAGCQTRVAELDARTSRLRRGQLIALIVMSVSVIAVIPVAWLTFAVHTARPGYLVVPVLPLIASGVVYQRRRSALLSSLRLRSYYDRAIARLEGRWAGSGLTGEEFSPADHAYDKDLNVFGKGSLFELLCTCRTQVGRRQLAAYFLDEPRLLGFDSVFEWFTLVPWMLGILAVHSAWGLLYRTRLLSSSDAISSAGAEVGVLREGLRLLGTQKFSSPLLARLTGVSRQLNAPAALRKFERFAGALTERNKEWFYLISRALLVGTQIFWSIEEWKLRYCEALILWLSVWGEFEALMPLPVTLTSIRIMHFRIS